MRITNLFSVAMLQIVVMAAAMNKQANSEKSPLFPSSHSKLNDRASHNTKSSHGMFKGRNKSIYAFTPNEINTMLREFLGNLKKFVSPTKFCVSDFEAQAAVLELELSDLVVQVEELSHVPKALGTQLEFAKTMFEIMADSIEYSKYFRMTGLREHRWVWATIEMRVLLLAVHDTYANAETIDTKTQLVLASYKKSLTYYKDKMATYPNLSYGVRRLFKLYCAEAEHLLDSFHGRKAQEDVRESFLSYLKRVFTASGPSQP